MTSTSANVSQVTGILAGKTVVVTGAANGLGRAIALAAARHGAGAVVVSDLQEGPREGGPSVTAELEGLGVKTLFVRADVTKQEDNEALVAAAEEFGGVDVMVANAGILLKQDTWDQSPDDWHRLQAVNLDGPFFGAQAAGRSMLANKKAGSIVLTGSMMGFGSDWFSVAYSSSKGAVNLLAKALADSFGPDGIRVNVIAPGPIESSMLHNTSPDFLAYNEAIRDRAPLRRFGKPEEIGDAVAFLGSDLAGFVTATTLLVDGGITAKI